MSADRIFYPENQKSDTTREQLIQMLLLSDNHELLVIKATAQALLNDK
ncbi:hypothetical protein [Clostridium tyrobutyricum]|nr:hypothetical protein [Clostridium tyrobutyricum]